VALKGKGPLSDQQREQLRDALEAASAHLHPGQHAIVVVIDEKDKRRNLRTMRFGATTTNGEFVADVLEKLVELIRNGGQMREYGQRTLH